MEILSLFLLFIAIEIFESNWQKSDTLHGILLNNYAIYQTSIFLFFFLNMSFIYSLFLIIYLQKYTFLMASIAGMKFLDVVFKINIMTKLERNHRLDEYLPNLKIGVVLRYLNVIVYPISFYLAIEVF